MDANQSALSALKRGLAARDRAAVNAAAQQLIAARAPLGSQWQAISSALLHNGEINAALAAMDLLVDAANGSPTARFVRSSVLAQCGRLGEALAELDQVPASEPDLASNAYLRGTIATNQGDPELARAALQRALDASPQSGQIWLASAELADFPNETPLVSRLEDAWASPPEPPMERAQMGYAVGRMRHSLGNFEGAFAAFEAGARARRETLQQQTLDRMHNAGGPTAFPRDLRERIAARVTVPHQRVIFVSGLPRSGTTLLEQILTSHPEVKAGGEVNFFSILAQEIGGVDAGSVGTWIDRGGDPNDLVELYLHLASERFGGEGRFVDKSVEAGNYMGLVLALFPQAPVFWMRRDPIDNGWSAFRTYFVRGADWSWSLEDVGRRLAQEDALIDYWSNETDRLTLVDYEALVRDPEPHIRDIAAAAGLALNDAMLKPHETRRTVATASVTQVREPINLKGLGVADPYRAWLSPMVDAYAKGSVTAG